MANLKISQIFLIAVILLFAIQQEVSGAFGYNANKVKLRDVDVLTLYSGKMTNARRSSPIQQLNCVGGSAAHLFKPQVVQCYNRGSDGYDIQWECKTDMDNAYRFGKVEVSCEGYEYPDDPYILKGSCGLEYTLELTKEGYAQEQGGHNRHDYYGGSGQHSYHQHQNGFKSYMKKGSSFFSELVFLALIAVVIYVIYRTCLASTGTNADYTEPTAPPPPGWRQEYVPPTGGYTSSHTPGSGQQGGGFWTGAATGGFLGYLFGNSNNGYYNDGYQRPYHRRGWGSGWGNGWGSGWGNSWGSGWGNSGSSSRSYSSARSYGSGSTSTGTRTASGFGGTKRR